LFGDENVIFFVGIWLKTEWKFNISEISFLLDVYNMLSGCYRIVNFYVLKAVVRVTKDVPEKSKKYM